MRKQLGFKTVVGLFAIAVIIGVVVASVLYSTIIPMTFHLSTAYNIELWNDDKTELMTTIEWNGFAHEETKEMTFWLKNNGNIPYPQYWYAEIPSEWSFEIYVLSGDMEIAWLQNSTRNLSIGEELHIKMYLTEISAIISEPCIMDLSFNVAE